MVHCVKHPVKALVQVLVPLFPTQLPALMPLKVVEGGPSTRIPAIHMGDPSGVPGLWLHSGPSMACCCDHLGSEPANRISVCL